MFFSQSILRCIVYIWPEFDDLAFGMLCQVSYRKATTVAQSFRSSRNPGSLDLVLVLLLILPILVALCQVLEWNSVAPPPKLSSTCAPKIRIIALCACACERERVNISFHKYCKSHLRQKSDSNSHPYAMSQHSDNLPCLCNDPLLRHPQTLLLGVSKLACGVTLYNSCCSIDSEVCDLYITGALGCNCKIILPTGWYAQINNVLIVA